EVLKTMHGSRVGSMVIADSAEHPVGIFTQPDALARVALPGTPLGSPVSEVMTREPVTLEEDATLADAAIAMARRGIRHIVVTRHSLPGPWCWLALGSEGRMEQTFATDQDNALIYTEPRAKAAFLAFADEVNHGLAACGFPLCTGDVMARNPRWCLTPEEWLGLFGGWIERPEGEALLNASIFFDFRALAGDPR